MYANEVQSGVVRLFMSCVCHAFASVHCCLVVICWERADLLVLDSDVCDFFTFPCDILGVVLSPGLCYLSYFKTEWS